MATPQKIRCQVQKITHHGDHVYTVNFKPERLMPRFRAGQFLHLTLDEYEPSSFWPESRVFSIASSPASRDNLQISYSVKGKYTLRMEKELREGRWLWAKLPYGDFVIEDTTNTVLMAGGTGITAFIAFIASISPEMQGRIFLAYGARKPDLLLYRDIIALKVKNHAGVKAFYFVESGNNDTMSAQDLKTLESVAAGCLSLDAIWNRVENPDTATFYIAGPPAMIQTLTEDLQKKGIEPDRIKVDAWE